MKGFNTFKLKHNLDSSFNTCYVLLFLIQWPKISVLRKQRLKLIEWKPHRLLHIDKGGKGSRMHCSHKRGLEMNMQILTSIKNASQCYAAAATALCTCICVCANV